MRGREVVCDTSACFYLHRIGRLELLKALFERTCVPEGVYHELLRGRELGFDAPDLREHPWMEIRPCPKVDLALPWDLGAGELQVLALTLDSPERRAVLDDGAARQAAQHLGLCYTGTAGILLQARRQSHVKALRPLLDSLRGCGFRLGEPIYQELLRRAGEVL